ncbi:Mitotic spindle checkpoint component mad2 [Phlyctochytrium bullatum]|nr:Mitotic spindle checkpoint component mad2 [Phlyctochytrium bullatum]
MVKKYGLNLLMTSDENVRSYLKQLLTQVDRWIMAKSVSKLVLAICRKDSMEVIERWQFDLALEESQPGTNGARKAQPKTEKQINEEIAAILRQITASVSFLPVLSEPCTFNVLAYTDKNAEVPATWEDSDGLMIAQNAEQVKLRSFSTSVHRVDSMVAYKLE